MVTRTYQPLPSVLNALVARYQRSNLPAKYNFWQRTKKSMAGRVIRHYFDSQAFDVPWEQWCFWLEQGPANYYPAEMIPFTHVLNELNKPFDFVDLGADIGAVSLAVKTHCPQLQRIIALEPNPNAYPILQRNLDAFALPIEAMQMAISDFNGLASLDFDQSQSSDHEGSITPNPQGDIGVISLDQISQKLKAPLSQVIAIKIDVEGQEVQVFDGGVETISQAEKVVVLLEIHPDVLTKHQQTPEQLFEAAESIRPFEWQVPLMAGKKVDRNQAFFEQFAERQYDVIGISV